MMRCLPVGPFTLGHFLTNPPDALGMDADHIYRHMARMRGGTQGDFETTCWTVERASVIDNAFSGPRPPGARTEHIFLLYDVCGTIAFQDNVSEKEADARFRRVMTAIEPYQKALHRVLDYVADHESSAYFTGKPEDRLGQIFEARNQLLWILP